MKERTHIFAWVCAITLFLLGIFTCLFLPSYSFSGYVFLGLGLLMVCYRLLNILSRTEMAIAKALRTVLSICVCLGLLAAVFTGTIIYEGSLGSPETACDYIIVLGAGLRGEEPSMILRQRINAAYDYLTANPEAICIVSGGQGSDEVISEASCMYRELTEMGIDPLRVWQEDQSTSTEENLRFSLDIIEAQTGTRPDTVGVVSSEFHLYRAGLMAADQGLTAVGIPANTVWFSLWANYHMREIVAVWAYMLFGG